MDARGGERVNWRRWIQSHPPQTPTLSGCTACLYDPLALRYSASGEGCVRLYADCGRARFDGENRLVSVACPAVLCGSVPVSNNRIGAHHTWNARPCQWVGARIIDDTT